MSNKMKVTVTQNKNKPDEYTVEFDGNKIKQNRKNKNFIVIVIAAILVFLGIAFVAVPLVRGYDYNSQSLYYSNTTISGISEILIENEENKDYNNCKDSKNTCATKIAYIPNSKLTIKLNSDKPFTITKSINLYQILCMVFIICLTVTLISLITLLIKDDSNIRYEKLDILMDAKEDLLKGLDCDKKDKETKEVQKESDENAKKKDESDSNEKNENKPETKDNSCNKTTEKTTSEKSIKAGLVKHYMSCVSEI